MESPALAAFDAHLKNYEELPIDCR
jgi:hypothetical protein